jgi:site-specific recombinase XerD
MPNSKGELVRIAEHLFKRNGHYCVIAKIKNKQKWQAIEAIDKNTAIAERDRILSGWRKFDPATNAEEAKVLTFQQVVDAFLDSARKRGTSPRTLESVEDHLKVAARTLGASRIREIRRKDIQSYLDQRFSQRSGRTVNLDLIHIRKLFRYARDEMGLRWDIPTDGIKSFPHEEKQIFVPSQDQIDQVIQVLKTFPIRNGRKAASFIQFLRLSGVRLEEAQNALKAKIDLSRNLMEVRGKGAKWRIIDLFPALKGFLEEMLAAPSQSELLFPPTKGAVYDPRKALEVACDQAKVPRFGFHALRHAWATHLVEDGVDYATIAKWMGHSDGGRLVAERYGKHSRREHFQRAAAEVTIGAAKEA